MALVAHRQGLKGRRLEDELIIKAQNEGLGGVSVEKSYQYK